MLIKLRDAVKSWVALVFIALLAVSFALWGVADMFAGRSNEALASAGKRHIFPVDLDRALDNWIQRQISQGQQTSRADALKNGAAQYLLSQMIREATFLSYADKADISASTQAAANEIKVAPGFRDPLKGGFDRESYRQYLSRIRKSAEDFEAELRDSLTYNFLAQSPAIGFQSPDILAQIWSMHVGESRKISFVTITSSDVPAIENPDEAELKAYLEANPEPYRLQERRAVVMLEISADDFMDKVSPTQEQIQAAYTKRIKEFTEPETRTILRLSASERQPLQTLADQLNAGTPLETALEAAGDSISSDQNTFRSDELQEESPEIQQAFALEFGQALPPFPDPDDQTRWVSLALQNIQPGKTSPLSEIAEEIISDLRRHKAEEILYEEREQIHDLTGSGASLAEIAVQMGGVIRRLAPINQRGLTENNALIEALNPWPGAMDTAFQLNLNETSNLIEHNNALLLLSVEEIFPERLPEFNEIRAILTYDWRREKQSENIERIAMELEQANSFETLQKAAQEFGLKAYRHEQPLNRYTQSDNLEPELVQAAFNNQPRNAASIKRKDGSQIVLLVEEVIPISLDSSDNPLLQNTKQTMSSNLLRDMKFAFQTEVEAEVNPKRNTARINAYIRSLTGEP